MAPQSRSPSPAPSGPLPIHRLQDSVINRIAAGEIIHRPASALKELIENSLDAGSTSIRVTVKDGGLKLLQLQDNGCGIRKYDLPILAERFTTSKLTTYSDLSHLTTYGFRGEALASISYVAHLTVVTKTRTDTCAWRACYADGCLVPPKPGTIADPKPSAGNDGTTIIIKDMFHNTPARLSALRSSSEEYARILDVVTKYAIHNPHVTFSCKKEGTATPDVSTPSSSTVPQTIRLLYGQTIEKNLLHVTVSSDKHTIDSSHSVDEEDPHEDGSWEAEAHFTNADYQAKKMVFLLFINHRLVESPRMKKSLEAVYNGVLPKGTSPFIYLSLQIDPQSVDVNVHPTKREVHFLNEDAITDRISDAIQETLMGQDQSRVFEYQTLLTGGMSEPPIDKGKGKGRALDTDLDMDVENVTSQAAASPSVRPTKSIPKKTLSQHKVRTSLQDRTLDSMFPVLNPSQRPLDTNESSSQNVNSPVTSSPRVRDIDESECFLTSVLSLRKAIMKGKHHNLSEILSKHTFVGIVDMDRCLSLIQHSTKLYLINHGALFEELFYQLGLRQFGNMGRIKLDPAPDLRDLVALSIEVEETDRSRLTKPQIVDRIVDTLLSRREMLEEYFSLTITSEGKIEYIPLLLKGYLPNLDKLPLFLMRLGPQVNWTSEMECFETFLRELAYFYIPEPLSPRNSLTEEGGDDDDAEERAVRWQIEHVLFPNTARYLQAQKSLLDRDVVQVANLPDLYRVFERC